MPVKKVIVEINEDGFIFKVDFGGGYVVEQRHICYVSDFESDFELKNENDLSEELQELFHEELEELAGEIYQCCYVRKTNKNMD